MEVSKESIFVSALRNFCVMFFSVCGILLALLFFSFAYSVLQGPDGITETTTLNYLPNAQGKRQIQSYSSPVILQISLHGEIGIPRVLDTATVENVLLDSQMGILENRVKGILLHVNTPGGTVVDADNIYRLLQQYKERYQVPVFAYVDGLCASGGMYVCAAADQIYASPSSILGSVGVIIGPFFNFSNALEKIGVASQTITQGLDKDMMSPFRPWKAEEDASLKAVTAYLYHRFVDVLTQARPQLDKEKLIHEYGAQIFDPAEAQRIGYADVINASRDQTLLALLEAAHIDPKTPYQVVELQPKNPLLATLFNASSPLFTGKIEHTIDAGISRIRDQFAYLYLPTEK